MDLLDVSIIIPYFDRPGEISNLLAGLESMEIGNMRVETLVIEDGTPIPNKEELKKKCINLNLRFLTNERNMGPGYSRNLGAQKSQGRYLWFIDSDMQVVSPRVLGACIEALSGNRIVVGGMFERVKGVLQILRPARLPALHFLHYNVPFHENYGETIPAITAGNLFIERKNFIVTGGFDADLKVFEDNEFCFRLQKMVGGAFYQNTQTMMLHLVSPKGRDAGFFDYCKERRRYFQVKLRTRNILLKRYYPWRLLALPLLEIISAIRYLAGLRRGTWSMSRFILLEDHPLLIWFDFAYHLAKYNLYAMVCFLWPFSPVASRRPVINGATSGNFFLNSFLRSDRLFRLFYHLPKSARNRLIDVYVSRTRRKAEGKLCPERMTVFLTNQCNMKCSHCFIVKEVQPKLQLMTLGDFQKLFLNVRDHVSQILFTGGEPTLRKDFVDIVVAASELGRISTVGIFSNGLHTNKLILQMEEILKRCDIRINYQTSIDGLENFHDDNRRVPGAFEGAVSTIKQVLELVRRHPGRFGRVISATAISRQNLDTLGQICDVVTQTGASPAFGFVRTSDDVFGLRNNAFKSDFAPEETKSDGTPKFSSDDYLSVDEMDHALAILEDKVWRNDPGRLSYRYNRATTHAVRDLKATKQSPLSRECRMGFDDIVILADGLISRCEMLKAPMSLRDFNFDLQALLASAPWGDYLQTTSGCWCTHDCGIGVSMMTEPRLLKNLVP